MLIQYNYPFEDFILQILQCASMEVLFNELSLNSFNSLQSQRSYEFWNPQQNGVSIAQRHKHRETHCKGVDQYILKWLCIEYPMGLKRETLIDRATTLMGNESCYQEITGMGGA